MWRVAASCLLVACQFRPGVVDIDASVPADAAPDLAPDGKPDPLTLRVGAWMDGRSQLVFQGSTVHWHHYDYAAPGREAFVNKPTTFDGVEWLPTWPDQPDAENRFCDCDSSSYETLPISVPTYPTTTTVTPVAVRAAPSVIQQATAANNWTLIVELSDLGSGGSFADVVDITITYD